MKNAINLPLVIAALLFSSPAVYAVSAYSDSDIAITAENDSELGTYQVQVVNSRLQPYIPGDIDDIVRKNRKQNETTYVWLDNTVRIKILSQNEISSPNFKPLEQIAHVSE